MGVQVGVITDNKHLLKKILGVLNSVYEENKDIIEPISVIHLKLKSRISDYVKFEFPDYMIFCIDRTNSDILDILGEINQDPWLHSTGIIIIHPEDQNNYKQTLENLSILSYLNTAELDYQLSKILKIVMINKTSFIKKSVVESLIKHKSGDFVLENDPSVVTSYVNIITTTLLNEKLINPNTENSIRITLTELLMNAIEHGNCGISYQEKSAFLEKGGNINDLIKEKCFQKEIKDKKVYLLYNYTDEHLEFIIRDCGKGFDHKKMSYNPECEDDLCRLHGRGIFLSKHYAAKISYNDVGNEVAVRFIRDTGGDKKPLGFSLLKVNDFNPGDIVFNQDDRTNSLFYIQTGIYNVEVNGQIVAELDPSDIFLGEMSFLMNNKRVATIKAKTKGSLIEIPKSVFIEIVKKYPNYGLFLSKLLAIRLEKMNQLKTT